MKKIICIILVFLMLSASASATEGYIDYFESVSSDNFALSGKSVPTLDSGNIIIEAEDMEYSSDAKIISDSDASGGYAITCAQKKYASSPEEVENVTMSFKINVPVEEMGRYSLWCRLKTPKGGISYFEKIGSSSKYQTRWFTQNTDYYWTKLSTLNLSDGTFEYNIKYRDHAFRLDKFIITNNTGFKPVGKNDVPDVAEPVAPLPPFTPPAGVHPRVLFRSEDIPVIKENAKHPLLSTMYSQVRQRAFLEMDCHMPDNGGVNNVSIDHVFNIQCRALMYAFGEADKNHAKQTVQHMKDMYDTLVWSSANDITRQMGAVLATSGCVYDWCYDVLTDEDKDYFILQMKRLALKMEIGFPAGMGETFAGHGGEGELFYFQSTAGIAIYDEDPQMYNAAAGVLYEYMFETRKAFNAAGIHPAGSAYGPVRAMWEVIGQLVFERMGDESVMGDDFDKIPLTTIHMRQPNGMYVEDGDTWIGISSATGPTYQSNDLPLMVYSSYYDNPYVYGEAVKQLSLRGNSAGSSIYDNGVLALLFLNPNKEFAYPDDYGSEMPLTHFTSYPITTMTARTSWRQGMLGETAQVFVNGQEKLVGDHDHEHSDIGGFSIYYKGLLTSGGGTYSGEAGGWGIPHYYNYYRRTVSKNCVTVYDPNESFKITGYPLNYDLANDGGQRFEENTNTYDEFVSHKDHAKTESTYAGPNRETPEFSYLKTDLTNAYSDKITGYTRSTVALNLFNTDYPLAFICYDNISSSDASFKKTWNLQSIDIEPETVNNVTTISRNTYGYTGKLVVNTLIPEGSNAVFENVGGEGKESFSGGVNYPNLETAHEQGLWRLELSPKESAKDDVFLNAMFVTDIEKNLPDLPMTKIDTASFVGVSVMDRIVFFSKKRDVVSNTFTINIPKSEYDNICILITDVEKGKWQVAGENINFVTEVKDDENVIYARLAPGDYTFTKADDALESVKIDYPRDERTLRVGDVLIYDRGSRRFEYTIQPTALKDGIPYLSEDDFRAYGASVTVNGNQVALSRGTYNEVLTIGDTYAVINGSGVNLESAPFVGEGGKVYIGAEEHSRVLGLNTSYDSLSRILKVSAREGAQETISISMPDGLENRVYYCSDYSPYTLEGTQMVVRPTANLKSGQKIAYFLNGKKVGERTHKGNFTFKSVYGINKMEAKIMEGDIVVATSNIIEKNFTPIIKNGKDIYQNDLSEWEPDKFYYGQSSGETFVEDPDGGTGKVMKIENSESVRAPRLQIKEGKDDDYFEASDTGSGIIKYDCKIYVENLAGTIDVARLSFACGNDETVHHGNLYIDEPNGALVGASRERSLTLQKNEWVDMSIVLDNERKVFDVTIDGVQVVTGKKFCSHSDDGSYLKTLCLPLFYYGDSVTYYLKDVEIYKCKTAGVIVSPVCENAKVTEGTAVVINSETIYKDADLVYYCNGVKYEDNKVLASAGTNEVYAEAVGENGEVLGKSDVAVFEAYADDFVSTYKESGVTFEASTDNHNRKTGRSPFSKLDSLPRLYWASADVTVDSIANATYFSVAPTFHIKTRKSKSDFGSTEVYPGFFVFTTDGIKIATGVSDKMAVNNSTIIPYASGKDTYNIKMICDPLYGSYILLVDDVVYSVIDVSKTEGNSEYDLTPRQDDFEKYGFLYFDCTLAASSDEDNPNKVTLSNYEAGYSLLPEIHSDIKYISNSKLVTKTSELTNADDLIVNFAVVKGDCEKILCIATIADDYGKLISLASKCVTFGEDEAERVNLTLESLPSDIVDGNYSVNVMLWNADNLAPLVPKAIMPEN